jgi:hypothetical protein
MAVTAGFIDVTYIIILDHRIPTTLLGSRVIAFAVTAGFIRVAAAGLTLTIYTAFAVFRVAAIAIAAMICFLRTAEPASATVIIRRTAVSPGIRRARTIRPSVRAAGPGAVTGITIGTAARGTIPATVRALTTAAFLIAAGIGR